MCSYSSQCLLLGKVGIIIVLCSSSLMLAASASKKAAEGNRYRVVNAQLWAKAKHGKWEFQVSEGSGERVFQARWWWGVQFHRAYRLQRLWIYTGTLINESTIIESTSPVRWFQTDGLFCCGSYNMSFLHVTVATVQKRNDFCLLTMHLSPEL